MEAQAGQDWHEEDVKAAIRKTGITLFALSEGAGFHNTAVGKALREPIPRVEALIANRLGLKPWDIWPSRYDDDGSPKRGLTSAEAKLKRSRRAAHGQKVRDVQT